MDNIIISWSEKLGSMTLYIFLLAAFNHWFTASNASPNRGWYSFIKLATINDPKSGFIVKDSCLLHVKISVRQAVVRKSPLSTWTSGWFPFFSTYFFDRGYKWSVVKNMWCYLFWSWCLLCIICCRNQLRL